MIAKLITWGQNRDAAIDEMRTALDTYYIRGVETNIAFLASLMQHPRFLHCVINGKPVCVFLTYKSR